MISITLDTGALIAVDRRNRQVIALLARVAATDGTVAIPASALAQAVRDPARQAGLSRLIRQPNVEVVPLDTRAAIGIGRLLAASDTKDVVDAHVVLTAREFDSSILTSDPDDMARLDPTIKIGLV